MASWSNIVICHSVSKPNSVHIHITSIQPLLFSVRWVVHWRSRWSFTPRPEGTHRLSRLWGHKESQVPRRAWLAALICYLWLISQTLSHRWWCQAINLTQSPLTVHVFVCMCACVSSPRGSTLGPMVNMQRPLRWKAGHKSNWWSHLKLTSQLVLISRKCVWVCACVCMRCKNTKELGSFVLPHSLLSASSTDTRSLLKFGNLTFLRFMCYTDWLVHTMQI